MVGNRLRAAQASHGCEARVLCVVTPNKRHSKLLDTSEEGQAVHMTHLMLHNQVRNISHTIESGQGGGPIIR
jgi:hypothetical protein